MAKVKKPHLKKPPKYKIQKPTKIKPYKESADTTYWRERFQQANKDRPEYKESDELARLGEQVKDYQNGVGQPTYSESDELIRRRQNLENAERNKPQYTSQYADTIKQLADKIANRKEFSYDFSADPMYQNYRDQYMRQAALAQQNTMGQAAALSGGYGNSYAATAGSLAYQDQMSKLNEVIPQLYEMAYNKYNSDLANQREDFSMYQGLEDTDYGRYRDQVGDWQTDRAHAADAYRDERSFDYNKYRDTVSDYRDARDYTTNAYRDARDFNYGQYRDSVADWENNRNFNYGAFRDEQNFDYGQYRDKVGDTQWTDQFNADQYNNKFGYQQENFWNTTNYNYQQYRDQVGDQQWKQEFNLQKKSLKGSGSGSRGGGGSYSRGRGSGISANQRGVYNEIRKWINGNDAQRTVAWNSLNGGVLAQKYGLTQEQAEYLFYDYLGFSSPPSGDTVRGSDGAQVNTDSNATWQTWSDIPKRYRSQVLTYKDFIRNMPSDASLRQYKSYADYLAAMMKKLTG